MKFITRHYKATSRKCKCIIDIYDKTSKTKAEYEGTEVQFSEHHIRVCPLQPDFMGYFHLDDAKYPQQVSKSIKSGHIFRAIKAGELMCYLDIFNIRYNLDKLGYIVQKFIREKILC